MHSYFVHSLTPKMMEGKCEQSPVHTLTVCSSTSLCKLMHGRVSVRSTRNISFLTTGHNQNAHFPRVCVCVPAGLPTPLELTLHPDSTYLAFEYRKFLNALGIHCCVTSTVLLMREQSHLQHHGLSEGFSDPFQPS